MPPSPTRLPSRPRRTAAGVLTAAVLALALPGCIAPAAKAPPSAPLAANTPTAAPDVTDPHLWLEAIDDPKALDWVRTRNAEVEARLVSDPRFGAIERELRGVMDATDRLALGHRQGSWVFNFWRDAQHPRGLWRRTTLAGYDQPEPRWETLLDLDALAQAESEPWVWAGAACLGAAERRCLISLSRGGADATVVREFDLASLRFVADGFHLPEAKQVAVWLDTDQLLVTRATDPLGATRSGYARAARLWRRGQALASAELLHQLSAEDVGLWAAVDHSGGAPRPLLQRSLGAFEEQTLLRQSDGRFAALPLPVHAEASLWGERLLVRLRKPWTDASGRAWPEGALLVGDLAALQAGRPNFHALFTPTPQRALEAFTTTRAAVVLTLLEDVATRVERWQFDGGRWQAQAIALPQAGTGQVTALHDARVPDDPLAETLDLVYQDFLSPPSLRRWAPGQAQPVVLQAQAARFDAAGMRVAQHFARSRDGTRVPYFVLWPRGASADGQRPTLLYGYGGFEVSERPFYSGGIGRAWLARGGVFVLANLRGGGEYGPAWHQAAVGARKQASYDDFAAVAEDLIARGITSPRHLGIQGGSNGGLLVGAVMLQRPELFHAVVSQVPLMDMRRYHRLLAGASWMSEYGDPDQPQEWAWIAPYSPYQNVRPGMKLPELLLTTSTRDDRVHPGHARKMAARMREQGHAVLSYEAIEGGHAGAADNAQRAKLMAMAYTFFWQQLGGR